MPEPEGAAEGLGVMLGEGVVPTALPLPVLLGFEKELLKLLPLGP